MSYILSDLRAIITSEMRARASACPRCLTAGGYRPSSHPLGYGVLRVTLGTGSEPQIRAVTSNRTGNATPDALPRCCAIAGERKSGALLRGSGLEDSGCAGLCHLSIGVRLPRERRPSGFHYEFCLFPGRRDGRELAELLGPGHIGLLPGETDRAWCAVLLVVQPPQLKPTIMVRMLPITTPQTPGLSHARCPCMEHLLVLRNMCASDSKGSGSCPAWLVDQSPLRSGRCRPQVHSTGGASWRRSPCERPP